jgi:hypothetical protein
MLHVIRVALAAVALHAAGALQAQAPPPPRADAPPTQEQVERRIQSVGTLIGASSAARQIAESRSPEAAAAQAHARTLHESARQAAAVNDFLSASRLLDVAAKAMVEAVRMASPETVVGEKRRADFETRFSSAQALLDAQKRIVNEKGAALAPEGVTAKIESLLAESRRLAAGGNYDAAQAPLDQAYLASKATIGTLRGGDTLVRTLTFASKEEEYHYEIDRNDTHRLLIDVLVRGRPANASTTQAIADGVAEAGRLRRVAEAEGAARQFERAIATLEESTRALVRAIRAAGIYIPG